MLILASLPGIMLELKYGYDVFYDVRIRAIASFLSVLSVPAYALVWTIFLSYFNKYIKCFFVCLTVLVLMLDVYCYTQYHILFNEVLLQEVCGTNYKEAWEYVAANINVEKILIFTCVIAVCIITYRISDSVYLFITKNIVLRRGVVAVVTFLMIILNSLFALIGIGNGELLPPNKIINMVSVFNSFKQQYETASRTLSGQNVSLNQNDSTIPYVIFILGESTSRTHMGLYGYKKDTNPLLTARLQKDNYYIFDDTIASSTHTLGSLKRLFTFYNNDSVNEWYENTNLFAILKKAGYKTYWLSNQEPIGLYAGVQYLLAQQCDFNKFLVRDTKHYFSEHYDGELLTYLDDILAGDKQEKTFMVLHLAGAHQLYRERYPADFAKFHGSNNVEEIIAEYDNAILYNDYIINEILKRFEDKNAIVFYVPDHGEDVYENGSRFMGHGPNGTMHQQEIPMLVWGSDSFKYKYNDKWLAIGKSVHKPFMTDNLIHAILGIMDIKTNEYKSREDLFSKDFDEGRRRVYNNREYRKELVEYDLQNF